MADLFFYTGTFFALLIFSHYFFAVYGLKKAKACGDGIEDEVTAGISVIKPVKGLDENAYENFASFCRQNYRGPYEIIFSLQDEDDPALPILKKLKKDFPHILIKIIVNPVLPGFTGKSSNLFYGVKEACYPFLIFSDADMYAEPDFVERITRPLTLEKTGIVAALPIHTMAKGFWARVYQLQLNSTILAQWLPYASIFKLGVAGGTIALRREVLEEIGGVRSFASYLAEDVRIGLLVKKAGYGVEVGYPVFSPVGNKSYTDLVSLLARGTLIYRRMLHTALELPYLVVAFFYFLTAFLFVVTGDNLYLVTTLVHLGAKILTGYLISKKAKGSGREAFLVPVLDLVFIYTYIKTLIRGTLSWRGIRYRVDGEGKLEKVLD